MLCAALLLNGCAGGTQAEKGAGEGAKYGAVGGAVAGAVSALIFGGNPLEGAVSGAIVGAASGAATGAMAGSQADAAAKAQAAKPIAGDPKLAALRQKLGETNYTALMLLAQCQHRTAIVTAQDAVDAAKDPQQKTYGMIIQALAAEESGDKATAGDLYPKIVALDPARGSPDKLRGDALEGLMRVQAARKEYGLPATCAR